MSNEKRAHPRFETRVNGRLLSLDGRCNFDCTIIDISEGGVRAMTDKFGLLPNRVFLFMASSGDFRECNVRWRRDGEAGLRFVDVVSHSMRKELLRLCARQPHA